jgi:hypothetical protein|tara:strand:- start:583 stop:735 length:153 start_codon:yes stop_codon:yes gene_type:complete
MIHKIILSKEDDEGNITYYTTNDEYDHSILLDYIELIDLKEINANEVLDK